MEERVVGDVHRAAAIEIGRGQLRLLQQRMALRFTEQFCGFSRRVDEATHVLHEGGVQRPVEGDRADDGHQECRRRGDDREQTDDANMQARRGRLFPPGADQRRGFRQDKADEGKDDDDVRRKQRQDHVVCRRDRR